MGAAIRLPFRKEGEPDVEAPEEDLERADCGVIREHDLESVIRRPFTATPAPTAVSMFVKPFDYLCYFNIIKEKLKERGADYKVLYAFSDFVHGDERSHQRTRGE